MPRATAMMGVPTFYTRLLKEPGLHPRGVVLDPPIRLGLGAIARGDAPGVAARTGHAILERYGMTETNMSTSNPYEGDRVAGTVGFPLPGVDLRVVDPKPVRRSGPTRSE